MRGKRQLSAPERGSDPSTRYLFGPPRFPKGNVLGHSPVSYTHLLVQQRVEYVNALAILFDGPPDRTMADPQRLPQYPLPQAREGVPVSYTHLLKPTAMEFWQGRPSRLHDRLRYVADGQGWKIERLSP